MLRQNRHRASRIDHAGLRSRIELAPGGATLVQQRLPSDGIGPGRDLARVGRGLLEIDELVIQPLRLQPLARPLDGVALVSLFGIKEPAIFGT